MKNILTLSFLSLILFSCNEVPKQNSTAPIDTVTTTPLMEETKTVEENLRDTIATVTTLAEEPETERLDYRDSIKFEKYPANPEKRRSNAPINWASYPEARTFRTRIIEAYKENEVSFAGHYVLATFGCGAGCIMGFMVDVRDGVIYDLPLGEEHSCFFAEQRIVCKSTSKLFISGVCKENADAKKVFYTSFLWDEENKKFNPIDEKDFIKKN